MLKAATSDMDITYHGGFAGGPMGAVALIGAAFSSKMEAARNVS